jgi:hypothetical protein
VGAAGFAGGGSIFRPRGTDTVPAMLTPGEFVVNRASAMANKDLLERINGARGPVYKADGGIIGLFKKAAGGMVDGVKEAGRTVADAAGYGPEGRKKEELDRKLAEANKDRPQYRADGGPLFSPEEAERRRKAFEDPNSVAGFVPSAVPGVRDIDDFGEYAPSGRVTPQKEPPARGPTHYREAAYPEAAGRASDYLDTDIKEGFTTAPGMRHLYDRQEPSYPVGRRGREGPDRGEAGTWGRYWADQDISMGRALANAQGRPWSADDEKRVVDRYQSYSWGNERITNPAGNAGRGPAPRVTEVGGLPADLHGDLQREAALNPYGQSALLLAGQKGGNAAVGRLAFAGQVADFNRRSYAANFSHNAVAEASALSHQRYTSEAYRRYKESQGVRPAAGFGLPFGVPTAFTADGQLAPFAGAIYPRRFATGGMVPGFGNHDSVPSLLTPGEFVLRQSAVQKLGVANAQALNSGGPVKYYADGGGVSGSTGDGGAAALAQAAAAFNQSAQQMAQAFTIFSGPAQALAKAMESMPRTLNVTGQHTVVVTVNGAEAFSKMTPAIEELVTTKVNSALNRVFKEQAPDLGVQVG